MELLIQNGLVSTEKLGFTLGKSTTTAIIELFEQILYNFEEGNTSTTIFVDLTKVFGCLGHSRVV